MKKITLLFLFLIGSITSSFGQFTEGFEAGIPATWTVINGGDANTWTANTFTPHGGTGQASIVYTTPTAHDDYLISPAITVSSGVNDRISFWARSRDPLYPEVFDVLLSTTTPTAAAFTITLEAGVAPISGTAFYQYTYDLSAYAGQTVYVGIYSSTADQFILDIDDFVSDTAPALAPGCATLTAPANAATGVDYTAPVVLTWTAPTTGGPVASYDVYLDTNAAPTTLVGNQTALTYSATGLLASTNYYWTVIAKNSAGSATGCSTFSFTTGVNPFLPYCGPLAFTTNVEPITLVNFAGINNTTSPTVNGTPAHENFISTTGNVIAGSSYTITLKGNTDGAFFTNNFIVFADWNQDGDFADVGESYPITQTITGSTGIDAISATQSLDVPPTALVGTTRMRVKKIYGTANYADPCQGAAYGQVEDYSITVAAAPTDLPDYANLQYPYTATIAQGGSVTVYGRVYEGGLTDTTSGQAPGIQAWVGYSTTDSNPNTFTNWIPATFNVETDGNNNDEYQANIGAGLVPGTYYYATRFQLNGGAYVYGGTNFGFWNGTDKINGVLTVNPPVAPANDDCTGAVALTPGGVFSDNAVSGTMLAATLTSGVTPTCQVTNIADVWYTVVVPASGNITIETQVSATTSLVDTVVTAFSGTCGSLVEVGCDDDGGPAGPNNLMSLLSLTGQTPGSTLYVGVWKYGTVAADGTSKDFRVSAYDASLGNSSFDNANFTYYPNPVKNILNLSYSQEISNVEAFNLLGQKVSSNRINANSAQVDMSNLSKGAYMVKVTSNNQVKTIKVIKE